MSVKGRFLQVSNELKYHAINTISFDLNGNYLFHSSYTQRKGKRQRKNKRKRKT